jgi:hypothetical protein
MTATIATPNNLDKQRFQHNISPSRWIMGMAME